MREKQGDFDAGVNQKRAGHFNERLLISLIHRDGPTSAGPLSQRTGLSFQAVSVILRRLEKEGLVRRGDPLRGQIGKPVTPVMIDRDGAMAFGLKIGRRSSDLVLIDLTGETRAVKRCYYERPHLDAIIGFLRTGTAKILRSLAPGLADRIVGLGVARPGTIGTWPEGLVLPSAKPTTEWDDEVLTRRIREVTDLPLVLENDATAACQAEYAFGNGKDLSDFAYFYIGTFIGGGLVLNDTVFRGKRHHAGAFGAIRFASEGAEVQLVQSASLHLLETSLRETDKDLAPLLRRENWHDFEEAVDRWINQISPELARAIVQVCAVIDFDTIFFDGSFPASVREHLVQRIRKEYSMIDRNGVRLAEIHAGKVGRDARAIGAATSALMSRYFPVSSRL